MNLASVIVLLTHFNRLFNLYTSWKRHKSEGFLMFQGLQKWNIGKSGLILCSNKIMNAGNCHLITVSIWASPLHLRVIALKGD